MKNIKNIKNGKKTILSLFLIGSIILSFSSVTVKAGLFSFLASQKGPVTVKITKAMPKNYNTFWRNMAAGVWVLFSLSLSAYLAYFNWFKVNSNGATRPGDNADKDDKDNKDNTVLMKAAEAAGQKLQSAAFFITKF